MTKILDRYNNEILDRYNNEIHKYSSYLWYCTTCDEIFTIEIHAFNRDFGCLNNMIRFMHSCGNGPSLEHREEPEDLYLSKKECMDMVITKYYLWGVEYSLNNLDFGEPLKDNIRRLKTNYKKLKRSKSKYLDDELNDRIGKYLKIGIITKILNVFLEKMKYFGIFNNKGIKH